MGRNRQRDRGAEEKKVERLGRWAEQVAKNGELPPSVYGLDAKALALYKERGIAILEDEYESFLGSLFLRASGASEYGYTINFEITKLWCERAELDALEVYDILSYMGAKANKGK